MTEIKQKYLPYIGKSYFCDLDDGIVFTINSLTNNGQCINIHKVDCDANYSANFMVDDRYGFEMREDGLHFIGCLCVEISDLQKTKMIHYFDKIHHKYKEYNSFKEVCIEQIINILENDNV